MLYLDVCQGSEYTYDTPTIAPPPPSKKKQNKKTNRCRQIHAQSMEK